MSIRRTQVKITGPAGTAISRPITGEILEVRCDGTALGRGSWELTRTDGGGTILAAGTVTAPWSFAPRATLHSSAGSAIASQVGPVPVAGAIRVVLSGGGTATDSVSIFYRE